MSRKNAQRCFVELVEAFKKRFIMTSKIWTYVDMINKTKFRGGSLLHYLDVMRGIANRGGIGEDVLVAFSLSGLPTRVVEMIMFNPKEAVVWNDIYSVCERLHFSSTLCGMNVDHVFETKNVNSIVRRSIHRKKIYMFLN